MKKSQKCKITGMLLSGVVLVGGLGAGCTKSDISSSNSQSNSETEKTSENTQDTKKEEITIKQFKNSYLAGCSDNCKIEEVFSCPYIGDSDNKEYTKVASDEFQIKYDKLAFVFRCDGEKSYLIKYINKSNEEGYQEFTDKESLSEIYAELYDWYNSYKNDATENRANDNNTNQDNINENKQNNSQNNNSNSNDNKATISESQALQLVKQKWESEYAQVDDLLGTPSYKYQGVCYHEDCNCQYKEKPSYLFSVIIVNEDSSSGAHPDYLCVYNDGSLVEFFNPKGNW